MTAPTPPVPPVRLAILASGGGSNLQAIIDHLDALGAARAAEVVLVASNRADAGALARARARNIPAAVIANPADGRALVTVAGVASRGTASRSPATSSSCRAR